MNNAIARPVHTPTAQLRQLLILAGLLERLDRSAEPVGADQYLSVVNRLSQELREVSAEVPLQAVLDAHPAAAELYENLQYDHAGLCRSPLDRAMATEQAARIAITRAMKA